MAQGSRLRPVRMSAVPKRRQAGPSVVCADSTENRMDCDAEGHVLTVHHGKTTRRPQQSQRPPYTDARVISPLPPCRPWFECDCTWSIRTTAIRNRGGAALFQKVASLFRTWRSLVGWSNPNAAWLAGNLGAAFGSPNEQVRLRVGGRTRSTHFARIRCLAVSRRFPARPHN